MGVIVNGEEYEDHIFEYGHKGKRWRIGICATSEEDAKERIGKIMYANYIGISVARIPASFPGSGLYVRLYCWTRNLMARWSS